MNSQIDTIMENNPLEMDVVEGVLTIFSLLKIENFCDF